MKYKKEDSVFFIAFPILTALLLIGYGDPAPAGAPTGAAFAALMGVIVASVLLGAIFALIPWGIAKLVVHSRRR